MPQPPLRTPPRALSPTLADGEEVLWTERKGSVVDCYVIYFLLGGLLFLIIYGLLVWDCLAPGGQLPEAAKSKWAFFLPGVALCCMLAAVYQMLLNRRTVYILTRQRAIVVRTPPLCKSKALAAPITPDMVKELSRHKDGTASYMFLEYKVGHMRIADGFSRVRRVQELEARLVACGLHLPEPEQPSHVRPSVRSLFIPLFLMGLVVYLALHRGKTEPEFALPLYGERTTATIIAHHPRIHMEGRRRHRAPVTRYHPVLQFRTADGSFVQATDAIGDKRPPDSPGDTVDILYNPQQPTQAMRAASNRFESHVILLLLFLGSLRALVYNLHRLYLYHKKHAR